MKTPGNVIVNSPFDAPQRHWLPQRDGTLQRVERRRAASYEIYDVRNNTRRVETLDQVNEIRQCVDQWRAADYPGITTVTRQLLAHWFDRSARQHPFYFCQLEAIETLIWWVEAADAYRQGVFLQGDGGPWERVCSKMATGSGKTTVMAMLITWQVLNAVTYPKRSKDFARAIFTVAPGLTRDPDVEQDLNRQAHEALPKLVQDAYTLLGADWRAALQNWQSAGHHSPPLMLTVCNRVETAARIEHYLNNGDAHWTELTAPAQTLRVDSKVLDKAEMGEKASSVAPEYVARLRQIVQAAQLPKDREERLLAMDKEDLLRAIVDNVGKPGQAGQRLQSVISVAMLSEGWDAKNVTHIMGLRAFTSQLLCEQVIGRGLRRVGYDKDDNGLFLPEYVNVFGVPLSVFVDTGDDGEPPPPPKYSQPIESMASRNELEVRWPNLLRVDTIVKPALSVQWSQVSELELVPAKTVITAEMAPAVGGATDLSKTTNIDLSKLPEEFRKQRIVFQAARKTFDQLSGKFTGNREYLVFQLIRLVEEFLGSKKLVIPSLFHAAGVRRRILIALNMDLIVQHVVKHVEQQNVVSIEPVFDPEQPIGSTRAMRTWYTTKGNQHTRKSQISHVVGDSSWEIYAGTLFDGHDLVAAYAKNDHLGFQIHYLWGGSRKRFVPDFIVRLASGKNLVLEIKGEDSPMNTAKRDALAMWVKAVNAKGGFGAWCWDVAFKPAEIHDILARHASAATATHDAPVLS